MPFNALFTDGTNTCSNLINITLSSIKYFSFTNQDHFMEKKCTFTNLDFCTGLTFKHNWWHQLFLQCSQCNWRCCSFCVMCWLLYVIFYFLNIMIFFCHRMQMGLVFNPCWRWNLCDNSAWRLWDEWCQHYLHIYSRDLKDSWVYAMMCICKKHCIIMNCTHIDFCQNSQDNKGPWRKIIDFVTGMPCMQNSKMICNTMSRNLTRMKRSSHAFFFFCSCHWIFPKNVLFVMTTNFRTWETNAFLCMHHFFDQFNQFYFSVR